MLLGLTTVEEGALEEGQADIDAGVDQREGQQDQGYAVNDASPSRVSAVSGTTVRTTFSQEEANELDSDIMLDSLKSLHTASEELLKVLIPSGVDDLRAVWEEISTEGTRPFKLYQKRLSAFKLYKSDYTTAQNYISPTNVARSLFEVHTVDEIPQDAPQPDSVLRTANLAYLLHMLLVEIGSPDTSEDEVAEILETADQALPLVVAGPSFDDLAMKLSIAITTQVAVSRMALLLEDPNYNPQGIATHAFFSEDDDGTQFYRHHHALHLDTLDQEHQAASLARITDIVDALKKPFGIDSQMDPNDALDFLRETYPWASFIDDDLLPYYLDRKRQLDQIVQHAGGIDSLDNQVKNAVAGRDDLKHFQALRASLGQAAGRPKRSAAPDEIQQLRALAQANAAHAATPQPMAAVAQMTAPAAMNQPTNADAAGSLFVPIEQFDEPATAPPAASRDIHDLSQFQNLKNSQAQRASLPSKGKARSFNDPQIGARRVEWDEDQPSQSYALKQSPGRSRYAPQSSLGKRSRAEDEPQSSFDKRTRLEEDWDPTQDGGPQDDEEAFETKISDNAAANERRRQAHTIVQHARPALSQPVHAGTPDARPRSMQSSPQRRNPGSAVPDPDDIPASGSGLSRAQEYQQATFIAKQERVLHARGPPRDRRVWTDVETEALMQYIENWDEEDNLHYVAMKRLDDSADGMNVLGSRTAEDLRFRARNVKVNLLL